MDKITSKDIEAIRNYLKKIEALEKKKPQNILTAEEWEEAMQEIRRTGTIPAKYQGRIAEDKVETWGGLEPMLDDNGKPILDEEGQPRVKHVTYNTPQTLKGYYDVVEENYNEKYRRLEKEYHDPILKALKLYLDQVNEKGDVLQAISITDVVKNILEDSELRKELDLDVSPPEVLDIRNLPNLLPTDKRLQYALTPKRNDYAYIMPFDYRQLHFEYDENGEIVIGTTEQYNAVEEAKDESNPIEAAGIDQPLLRQLFAATMKAYLCNYGNSITVYLPAFAREMNIDVSGANKMAEAAEQGKNDPGTSHNANDFFKKLKDIERLNGVWQNGSFYKVFTLDGYDREENTLTFSSPWFFKLAREILTTPANKKTREDGSIMWEITGISSLMKPSIVSARSKPTVEILATLLAGLKQYGAKPEAIRHPGKKYEDEELVEYKISFKTLIERIPLIMENLDACKPSNKTTLLQRYFCGSNVKKRQKDGKGFILEEYIKNYTYIPEYYKDFEIVFKPPTINTLSEKIVIRHRGINGHFLQNNSLNELLFQEVPNEESVVSPEEDE